MIIFIAIIARIRGTYEGFIFDTEKGREYENLIHLMGTILIAISYGLCMKADYFAWYSLLKIISYHSVFLYYHLGYYHETRNVLNSNVYPLGFMDWRPTTSKSWWDNHVFKYAPLTYQTRLYFLFTGILLYFIILGYEWLG